MSDPYHLDQIQLNECLNECDEDFSTGIITDKEGCRTDCHPLTQRYIHYLQSRKEGFQLPSSPHVNAIANKYYDKLTQKNREPFSFPQYGLKKQGFHDSTFIITCIVFLLIAGIVALSMRKK